MLEIMNKQEDPALEFSSQKRKQMDNINLEVVGYDQLWTVAGAEG